METSYFPNLLVSLAPLLILFVLAAGVVGAVLYLLSRFVASQRRIAEALERIEKRLDRQ